MPRTPCTVLFVDDDAALLRGLGRNLSEEDFDVITAVSAAEASVVLRRSAVDVVVCDQRMPGVTGIDFLAGVRRQYPHIVTLILSGHVSGLPIAMRAAEEIGIHEVLSKPCSAAELTQAIRRAFKAETVKTT
ncbi:MAG: response regulator [Planctomycetaceae bacterium]